MRRLESEDGFRDLERRFDELEALDTEETWTAFAGARQREMETPIPEGNSLPSPGEEVPGDASVTSLRKRCDLFAALNAFVMEIAVAEQRRECLIPQIEKALKCHFSFCAVTMLKNEEDPLFRKICWPLRPDEELDLKRSLLEGHVVAVSASQVIFPLKHEVLQSLLLLERLSEERISPDELDALERAARFTSVILQHARSFERIAFHACRDPLTRLYNRRAFESRLEEEMHRSIRYGEKLSLLLLDIDHFKRINDTHGHIEGDAILEGVAAILRKVSRKNDLAARWGGEEFVVLLPSTDRAGAYQMAERIRRGVETRRFGKRKEIWVTLSGGVATFDSRAPRHDLVRLADEALYKAKALGRNCIVTAGT